MWSCSVLKRIFNLRWSQRSPVQLNTTSASCLSERHPRSLEEVAVVLFQLWITSGFDFWLFLVEILDSFAESGTLLSSGVVNLLNPLVRSFCQGDAPRYLGVDRGSQRSIWSWRGRGYCKTGGRFTQGWHCQTAPVTGGLDWRQGSWTCAVHQCVACTSFNCQSCHFGQAGSSSRFAAARGGSKAYCRWPWEATGRWSGLGLCFGPSYLLPTAWLSTSWCERFWGNLWN